MIDWFTVAAQIVNFLILVALLRYFLYDRIVAAMDQRRQELVIRQHEIDRLRAEAEKELQAAREHQRQLEADREQLMAGTRDEVEAYRKELTAKARGEVEQLRTRWRSALDDEMDSFLRDLRRGVSEGVCTIARQALADLANGSLEQEMVGCFLEQLEDLGEPDRQAVVASLQNGEKVAHVLSSSDLPEELQQRVVESLRRRLTSDLDVRFERSDDLLCGIVMQTPSYVLAWDLRDYLDALELKMHRRFETEMAPAGVGTKDPAVAGP